MSRSPQALRTLRARQGHARYGGGVLGLHFPQDHCPSACFRRLPGPGQAFMQFHEWMPPTGEESDDPHMVDETPELSAFAFHDDTRSESGFSPFLPSFLQKCGHTTSLEINNFVGAVRNRSARYRKEDPRNNASGHTKHGRTSRATGTVC